MSKYRKVLEDLLESSEANEYLTKIPKTRHEAWLLTTALCSISILETLEELVSLVETGQRTKKLERKKVD
ncbi:MAG: hypothetical protein FVQ80_07015 [Planctomycetes bacterium]|nr:hypothetical protein [Planctomycetota bacterium]